MTRARGSLGAGLALALAAAATTWVAMCSWRGFTESPSDFLGPLVLIGAVIAISGGLLRGRLPGIAVLGIQLLLAVMVTCWQVIDTPLPVAGGWGELLDTFDAAVDSANTYAAPVPASVPPVAPLLVFGGAGAMLLVDLLACTLRRVPLAGLVLLTVYTVPVGLLDDGVPWGVFLLTAVGFLMMLFLHESVVISRWGRPLGEATDRDINVFGSSTAMRTSAGKIGGFATALAVVVPVAIPTVSLDLFDFGLGSGGDSEIQITNPVTDLRRDLKRGPDEPVIRLHTDDPNPSYLRIAVLNRFSDEEWSTGNRDVPTTNRPDGALPAPPGLDPNIPKRYFDFDVEVLDNFESKWLPTQPLVAEVLAPGDWRYDESTMDFISSDDDLTTEGLDYSMRSIVADLRARELAAATPVVSDEVAEELLELPAGMSQSVRTLARGVTDAAVTNFEKAVALQNFFRETGGFRYSLQDSPEGNGVEDLESFLDEDGGRVGYCEQFASAMAAMARMLGIPARVAVGFLKPDSIGGDTWEYSTHDMHAWPELYFDGAGWVRFEPTPAANATVPDYTTQNVPAQNPSFDPSNPTPSGGESETVRPSGQPIPEQPSSLEPRDTADQGGAGWVRYVVTLAVLLVLAALLLTPRLLRRRQRDARLEGGAEDAWTELWATATDLRLAWPEGRSPRQTRHWVAGQFGAPGKVDQLERPQRGARVAPEAVAALDRIVRELELLRYSRRGTDTPGALRDDVLLCVEALRAGVVPRVRRRGRWWPTSVLRRDARPVTADAAQEREPVAVGGVIEHI